MTAKTRSVLNSDADTNLANNAGGAISAADVRQSVKDLADSALLDEDVGSAAYADTGDFATAAQGSKADSALQSDDIGSSVQAYDAATLKGDVEDQTITGGARVTVKDLGNLSGKTITIDPGDGPIQKITNNGAGTINPGSNYGAINLVIVNTSGAGAITTSSFTAVKGDSFTTTNGNKFVCSYVNTADCSVLTVVAAQ
jgi:hypothetical protein